MTLAELTRNCFQNGISATKWLSLCKLFISKESSIQSSEEVEHNLSNSVLVLYRTYPGDPDLQKYLRYAVDSGMLSVSTFTSTFLSAARSSELHTAGTLHSLCRISIDAHYASGSTAILSPTEQLSKMMNTIQDGLALLRTAQSLPMAHSAQLTSSASELLMLLLAYISDNVSQIPTRQATVFLSEANELLQTFRLLPDVRQMLETFVLSLSLFIGDEAKAATEAQLLHTLHYAGPFNRGDGIGSSADADIVTFSLILHHLVTYRGHRFGSGSGNDPVALLVSVYRWTSWTPTMFYTQLFVAALTCMSQSLANTLMWKAFIVGRLPRLLSSFQEVFVVDNAKIDWHTAMQAALSAVFLRPDLIVACDLALSRPLNNNEMQEEMPQSFTRDLLLHLLANGLINRSFAEEKDPGISKDSIPRLRSDAQDNGVDFENFIESKLTPDVTVADFGFWMDRIIRDVLSHATLAQVVLKRFASLASNWDVEDFGHLCRILYTYDSALDVVALHIKIADLLFHALSFLEGYDCGIVGDPQTAISHLGDIVLFVQHSLARFHLNNYEFTSERRSISASYFRTIGLVLPHDRFSNEESVAYKVWYKALFDSSSEGIEDSMLRTTKPKTLLRISPTLFIEALRASSLQRIDHEVLSNGVSYFTGPILNWTLVGVVRALIQEIQRKRLYRAPYLETLQSLLLSPSCPRTVLCLCAAQILDLLSDKRRPTSDTNSLNADTIRRAIDDAIGKKTESEINHPAAVRFTNSELIGMAAPVNAAEATEPAKADLHIEEQPRQVVRNALAMARAGRGPVIDVERCLGITPPSKFLDMLWSELVEAASLGETERSRRIATFILIMPRCSSIPPMLPIFIHLIVPMLIGRIDQQQTSEQALPTELLVSIISSALTAALHLEWAVQRVTSEHRTFLGQTSAAMARRLADELRARQSSQVSSAVLQRLAASQTFVANFPVFIGS
ncbi:hypothetical protein M378DRAFT_183349 [Amanita muscaria Koide BX008]|uniref:Mediator of RNA polymerase II transcription subunit 5 n=1 Tax=Amanita muscaria (strain Koide BX008) TaxID=946122 RepID=A0A0C2XMG0_AMAMK|nr:hypothetical protein M378DRAFT_183349 [Amanita muscaria Koide BX008]